MACRNDRVGQLEIKALEGGQLGCTYLAVNSSNVSSWPCDAAWLSLSAASFALVLKPLVQAIVTPGTSTADREERGTAGRMGWDRKKVERAATRSKDVDDIRKVGGGGVLRSWEELLRFELRFWEISCERYLERGHDWLDGWVLVSGEFFQLGI
jgi:hypothetical protein